MKVEKKVYEDDVTEISMNDIARKGLKFKNKDEAKRSVRRLKSLYRNKKITFAHMRQIGTTMEQRAKYHAHPNKNIKEGMKIWKSFNRSFKKSK